MFRVDKCIYEKIFELIFDFENIILLLIELLFKKLNFKNKNKVKNKKWFDVDLGKMWVRVVV